MSRRRVLGPSRQLPCSRHRLLASLRSFPSWRRPSRSLRSAEGTVILHCIWPRQRIWSRRPLDRASTPWESDTRRAEAQSPHRRAALPCHGLMGLSGEMEIPCGVPSTAFTTQALSGGCADATEEISDYQPALCYPPHLALLSSGSEDGHYIASHDITWPHPVAPALAMLSFWEASTEGSAATSDRNRPRPQI